MTTPPPRRIRSPALRAVRRAASWPLVVLATILVLFDDAFRGWVKPVVAWIARLRLVARIERWIAGLPPYGIVALFLAPLAVIEPLKIAALYLIGTGHIVSGILTLVVAKIVGIGIAERLFAIGRDKLLSIGWFRWGFERTILIKDKVHAWLERQPLWRAAEVRVAALRSRLSAARERWRTWRSGQPRGGVWSAARRFAAGRALRSEPQAPSD